MSYEYINIFYIYAIYVKNLYLILNKRIHLNNK